jgi:hypothetical protein
MVPQVEHEKTVFGRDIARHDMSRASVAAPRSLVGRDA